MIEYGYEKAQYIDTVANHVKVTPRQLPKIYEVFKDAVETIDMPEPDLFIREGCEFNAEVIGSEHPFIVLNSALIEELNEKELQAVIGHELGHIKCKHVTYTMVANFLRDFIDIISGATFGIGNLLSSGLDLALFSWYRKGELSSDRSALLVTQDLDACLNMLMKLSIRSKTIREQISIEEFVKQGELYKEIDSDTVGKIYKFISTKYQTHPYSMLRAKELKAWADGDEYQKILQGDYHKIEPSQKKLEDHAPMEVPSPSEKIGEAKDAAVGMVKSGIKGLFGKSK